MPTDRKVIFTSRKVPNNSFTMRGEQLSAELNRQGYSTSCVRPHDLGDISGAIIIWVRRVSGGSRLRNLSARGNVNILDTLDRIDELRNKDRVYDNIDGVIFPAKCLYKKYENNEQLNGKVKYWLLHHYDPALKLYDHDHFEIGYWGYRTSAVNVFNFIPKKNRYTSSRSGEYPPDDFFKRVSCHYSVKDEERGLGWRPTTKISTAAACGANIIVSRDELSEEILPKDYPYFVDGYGYNDTKNMIYHACRTYGSDKWNYGLKCMANVRRETNITRCAEYYGKIIDDISDRLK